MSSTKVVYGFVGLGQMGHGMAKNIRQKIPGSCLLLVFDINKDVTSSFARDFGTEGNVLVVDSPKDMAQRAVSASWDMSRLAARIPVC